MNEELKQIAIKAKELGFKARTVTTIHTEKYLLGGKNTILNDMCFYLYLCDLQEWLRSNFDIHIILIANPFSSNNDMYTFKIYSTDKENIFRCLLTTEGLKDLIYQEALQEGIKESLKLIKT